MKLYWVVRIEDGAFISQGYGPSIIDYSQFGMIGHNGWDFVAKRGTPIHAAHDGYIIEQTAKDTGFGLRICQRVEADGRHFMLTYGHMLKLQNPVTFAWDWKNKSHPVRAGQIIGYVDSTGFSTGDHCHFGVYEYTEYGNKLNENNQYGGAIDPARFMADEKEKPFMSNVLLVKKGTEYGYYLPAISEDALIDKADNFGYPLPKSPDGKHVDWVNVKPEIII